MMQAPATETAKAMTELTCWKCGEESLKEMFEAVDPNAFHKDTDTAVIMHSICGKCGAQSVNARQSLHNKIAARKSRKAIIKETNRKTG